MRLTATLVAAALLSGDAISAVLTLGTARVAPGGVATVDATLTEGTRDVSTLLLDLALPAGVTLDGAEPGLPALTRHKVVEVASGAGGARLLLYGLNTDQVDDGVLLRLRLKVSSNATGVLALTGTAAAAGEYAQALPVTVVAGSLVVGDAAGSRVLVPSSAHVRGTGGTFWRTDLVLASAGTGAARARVRFLRHDTDGRSGPEKTVEIPGGGARTFEDVLVSLFGISQDDWGALLVEPLAGSVAVSSETWTPGASGSYGQSVPAFAGPDLVAAGESRSIAGVEEDAAFRTNLVLANAAERPVEVDIALVLSSGWPIASRRVALPPLGMTQVTRVCRELGVEGEVAGARVVVRPVTPGALVAAYASLIDNVTGDPRTLLPARPARIVPSSAHAPGTGATWTTDLTVANTGDQPAAFTLRFLGHDRDGRSCPERSFVVQGQASETYADVLASAFAVSGTGWGAIEIVSASDLVATAQTSTPGAGGTFGQSVPALGMEDAVLAGRPRTLPGIREDAAFRTNLILANPGPTPVEVELSLSTADGAPAGTRAYALPPLGMRQVTRVVRDLGAGGDVKGARLAVTVTTPQGAVVAYASVIDNASGDPRTILPR